MPLLCVLALLAVDPSVDAATDVEPPPHYLTLCAKCGAASLFSFENDLTRFARLTGDGDLVVNALVARQSRARKVVLGSVALAAVASAVGAFFTPKTGCHFLNRDEAEPGVPFETGMQRCDLGALNIGLIAGG